MSFYTSLTGLNSATSQLAVTSNNIANSGTTAFKRSRADFGDIFSTSPLQKSSAQIGQGVLLKGVNQEFSQGNISTSGNSLDLAITGDGFFPLKTADGGKLHQAMACGAFAEKVVVDQSQVVKIPEEMAMDTASLLSCGVITGVGAVVNAAGLRAGQDVVVIGAGGVGLNAIQGARIAGARRIVAVDMSEDKLDTAIEFGATDGVLGTGDKPWQAAKAAMGRGADAVIVTVGAIPAYDQAPRYLAGGGRVIMVGMPHSGAESTYEPVNFAAAGQGMIGSKMGDTVIRRDIPWMIDLYAQGRLKLDELISNRWTLDQINEAIADTMTGGARRNVIVFS